MFIEDMNNGYRVVETDQRCNDSVDIDNYDIM